MSNIAHAQTQASCKFQFFSAPNGYEAFPIGINNYGSVVGNVIDRNGDMHGFIRYSDSTWKIFRVDPLYPTSLSARNNSGITVGWYESATGVHGLVLYQSTIKTVDYPGASQTHLTGINRYGTIVGDYIDANGNARGFKLSNGQFTSIRYPGAASTSPTAISDLGTIVGTYQITSAGNGHGFVYSGGTYRSLSDPEGTSGTGLTGVNAYSTLVGDYAQPTSIFGSGFRFKNGAFQNVVVSGATETIVNGINNNGRILGRAFYQSKDTGQGFIATCQ